MALSTSCLLLCHVGPLKHVIVLLFPLVIGVLPTNCSRLFTVCYVLCLCHIYTGRNISMKGLIIKRPNAIRPILMKYMIIVISRQKPRKPISIFG